MGYEPLFPFVFAWRDFAFLHIFDARCKAKLMVAIPSTQCASYSKYSKREYQ